MKLKNYTLRLCRKDEYDKLIAFLHDYWNPNHVFCRNKEIFEFQHGKAETGEYDFVIAVHNESEEIHAVLGFIRSSRYDKNDFLPQAVYGALWKARDDVKDKEAGKLGLAVLSFLLKMFPESDYLTLGLSKDSQAIYEALHFDFGRMNHYYVASDSVNDFRICADPIIENNNEINEDYHLKVLESVPEGFDPYYFPLKSAEYICNRYLKHPFYEYKLLGVLKGNDLLSVWVYRECEAEDHGCMRIVDVIGKLDDIDYIGDNIRSFLKNTNCEYVDCYNYGIAEEVFLKMGFKEVEGACVIPNYFEPFEKKNVDIHYAAFGRHSAVIFKGDGDQDRPNLLNLKG